MPNWQRKIEPIRHKVLTHLHSKSTDQMPVDELEVDAEEDNENDDEEIIIDEEPKGFVIYPNVAALMLDWNLGKPISGVLVGGNHGEDCEFYCCAKVAGDRIAIQLQMAADNVPIYSFGLHYHKFECVENDELIDWNEINISNYAVLLPYKLNEVGTNEHMLALITSDWKSMGERGKLVDSYTVVLENEFEDWK